MSDAVRAARSMRETLLTRPQQPQRGQQIIRTFAIDKVGQHDDERTFLAGRGDMAERTRVRRFDHFRLETVKSFEHGINMLHAAFCGQ